MNASAGPPPLLAQAPPLLAAAPPPDALCFAGFVTLAFVPFAILSRAAEHGEWGRDFAPPWLLAAYGSLGAAYGACVFGVAPLAGAAHSYAFGLASVFASKHALVAAADAAGEESSKGAPAMALLTVAAAGATQAAVRFAGTVRDCAPVFAAVAAFVLLATARLAARWRAEVTIERGTVVARRRALAVLCAVALTAALQPAAGACAAGGEGSSALAALTDALVLFPASEMVC